MLAEDYLGKAFYLRGAKRHSDEKSDMLTSAPQCLSFHGLQIHGGSILNLLLRTVYLESGFSFLEGNNLVQDDSPLTRRYEIPSPNMTAAVP